MRSETSLLRLLLPTLLVALACNGDGPPDEGPDEVQSEVPHDQAPELETSEIAALMAANRGLSLDLYHALREGQATGEGFSISAYSLQGAFGMLYGGSVDPARSEIAQALHFTLEGERQHVAHNWLDAQLESRNLPAVEDGSAGQAAVELRSANGVWALDSLHDLVSTAYLDLLALHYDTGLNLAAFDSQPDIEREGINAWVSERTNGLIPELFAEGTINADTKLVLVNALYFKAPWLEPFSESLTQPENFTLLDDQVVSVPMMHAPAFAGRYLAGVDYQAAALPLRGGDLELVVVLPADFTAFEDSLDQARLTEILADLASMTIDLSIPKFELAASFELTPEFQDLGMVAPFSDARSFDAIAEGLGVIRSVVHQTVIKIDEKGTEAAAASGIDGGDGDGDGDAPPVLVIDRPFLLAIHDRPTGTLLFFGRVLDPSI